MRLSSFSTLRICIIVLQLLTACAFLITLGGLGACLDPDSSLAHSGFEIALFCRLACLRRAPASQIRYHPAQSGCPALLASSQAVRNDMRCILRCAAVRADSMLWLRP